MSAAVASVGFSQADQRDGRVRRVRSVTVIRTRTTLTPTMIQPMRCTPWSETLVWKTMPVMADAAIEPM